MRPVKNPRIVEARAVAMRTGEKRFFVPDVCLRGHISERYTSNGGCVQCMRLREGEHTQARVARLQNWPLISARVHPDRLALVRHVLEAASDPSTPGAACWSVFPVLLAATPATQESARVHVMVPK